MKIQMIGAICLCLWLSGCTTRKQMAARPSDAGVKAVYAAPFEKVKRASLDALGHLKFNVYKEGWDGERLYKIESSQGLSSGTTGRFARIVIQDDGDQTVFVLVESKASKDVTAIDEVIAKDLQKRIEATASK